MTLPSISRVSALGVDFAVVTRAQLSSYVVQALDERGTTVAYAMHVVGVNRLGFDPAYEASLRRADLIYADGTSVMLVVRSAGHRLPERIATQDFMYDAIAHCAAHGHPVYLLGGQAGLAAAAGAELERRYPGLKVAGAHDGFFDDGAAIAAEIRASGAHLLLVGMGCPREQIWSSEHGDATGVRVLLTVGGTFGYIVGEESRAPRIVQKTGTEWIWRLAQDPGRLASRYLGGIPTLLRQMRAARRAAR